MRETRILLVDDEALNLEILEAYFEDQPDIETVSADCGEAAWQALSEPDTRFDLILLDRMMPGLDGIGLLQRIRGDARLAAIPVILQTAANSPAQIREGLEAGAYYYLTKPYRRDDMLSIVRAALTDAASRNNLRQQLRQHMSCLQFLEAGEFSVATVEEAGQLAAFIAHACPCPDAAVMGISELLVNGVEHGNLGLSYTEKSTHKRQDTWQEEINRRAALPENRGKRVHLNFSRDATGSVTLRIRDEGSGFDWQRFLDMDPERAFDPNGRGIALARMLSFSSIVYEGCGNVAVATIAGAGQEAR